MGAPFWAGPISAIAAFGILALMIRFIRNPDRKRLSILRKALEYLPFVLFAAFVIRRSGSEDSSFAYDLVSVILWLLLSGFAVFILFRLSDKRVSRYYPDISDAPAGKKHIGMHILEWVDALLQAACLVLLINLFIFQLYAIPSESMVPEFMIGDRVVVFKTPSGPKFPLSDVGVPRMRGYKRGDIVVFNNPHYNDTKEARVRSFASQLVYMLTFTAVNINRDEYGAVKADPLVKRVTGIPGEKLMLVDGVLYSKRKGDDGWKPVQDDAKWAAWNIASLPRSELALVKTVPLTADAFAQMESVESTRANLDLGEAAVECRALADRFAALKKTSDTVGSPADFLPRTQREVFSLFKGNDEVTRMLLTTNGGIAWFDGFMTGWIKDQKRSNLFDEQSFRLDVLLKLDFGRLVVRNAELMATNATLDSFSSDRKRQEILADAQTYCDYIGIHDQRNMGEFPEGDEYIADNCYFMMGDNRFNSLDMRHSYDVHLAPVDKGDEWSFVYRSNLAPQYVPVSRILGSANFRFWPISRAGLPQ
jgi:signal peptidase I